MIFTIIIRIPIIKIKIAVFLKTLTHLVLINRIIEIKNHRKNRNFKMINLFMNSNKWHKLIMKIINKFKNSKIWPFTIHYKSMKEIEITIFHQD